MTDSDVFDLSKFVRNSIRRDWRMVLEPYINNEKAGLNCILYKALSAFTTVSNIFLLSHLWVKITRCNS